jgi:hypothetical protein
METENNIVILFAKNGRPAGTYVLPPEWKDVHMLKQNGIVFQRMRVLSRTFMYEEVEATDIVDMAISGAPFVSSLYGLKNQKTV